MANSEQIKKSAGDAVQQGKEKAGQLAHDNQDKITGFFGKIADTLDRKTSGKYSDKISKAKDAAIKGTDKLAEQRPEGDTADTTPETVAPETPETGTDAGTTTS